MTYFNSRDVAAIALCAALWGVLNALFAPVFFRMSGMPFLCDLIGFSVLILAAWWIRKFGAITIIGLVATAINFMLVPSGVQFLGFTAASIFFDIAATAINQLSPYSKPASTFASMMPISIGSAAVAGYLIAIFFMSSVVLSKWGGALGWAGLHAIGGVIGGAIGAFLVSALNNRKIVPNHNYSIKKRFRRTLNE